VPDHKWTTTFTSAARGDLRSVAQPTALRILRRIALLEMDPFGSDTTDLVGLPGYRRLRVGSYRVVYAVDSGRILIVVVAVGHRSAIYQRLGAQIARGK